MKSKPVVFLDRDGVLTVEKGYINRADEMEIFSYAKECIDKIHTYGYLAVVVTNQSGVARGIIDIGDLIEMNQRIISDVGIDEVYFCPHLFSKGIIPKYTVKCNCRKPDIGMINRACEELNIDLSHSWMVGDRASDILMAKNAGIKSVLVESGYGTERLEMDIEADYVCQDLKEFVEDIFLKAKK